MKGTLKRIMSSLLTASMLFSYLPASAEETQQNSGSPALFGVAVVNQKEEELIEQTLDVQLYTDRSMTERMAESRPQTKVQMKNTKSLLATPQAQPVPTNTMISITGELPEGMTAAGWPATPDLGSDLELIQAWELVLIDNEGEQKPLQNVYVQLNTAVDADAEVFSVSDTGSRQKLNANIGSTVGFQADGSPVYAVAKTILKEIVLASDGNAYRITVSYDRGNGLPSEEEGAKLYAAEILTEKELADVTAAIESKREENRKVAISRTFDIKILDKDGNEVQPTEGANVQVTFELVQVSNQNLFTDVYHLKNEGDALTAENLTVTTDTASNTATVTTDGFSLYTVEFTYEGKQYVLDGEKSVRLDEVLNHIGITGKIEDADVSDWAKFEVNLSRDGNWYTYTLRPFDTEEWLKVTVDGVVYEITVTDDFYGESAGGGSAAATFASGADIVTVTIQDLKNYPGRKISISGLNGGNMVRKELTGSNKLQTGEVRSFGSDTYLTITYPGAATTSTGDICDVIITYSDITLYGDSRYPISGELVIAAIDAGHEPYVTGKGDYINGSNPERERYGIKTNITVSVCPTGTTTPVNGTFFLTVFDLNVNRLGNSTENIAQAASNYDFSERIAVDGSQYDVYYNTSKLTRSGNDIYPRGNNGGSHSYESGVVIVANGSATFTAYQAGGRNLETNFVVMPRGGINHPITSYSGYGGSIATAVSGKAEDIVPGASSYLDGGMIGSERTYAIPAGKTVQYLLKPDDNTYQLKHIEIDGSIINSADAASNSQITDNGDGSFIYTFTNVGTTHKIAVFWEPKDNPELPIGHVAMEPAAGGAVVHTSLQGQVPTNHPAYTNGFKTTVPRDGTPSVMGNPAIIGFAPPAITGYTHFSYALGLPLEDESVPQTYYAKSDNLAIRYTDTGEYQYSVNYTNDGNDDNDHWETWTVTDEMGNRTKPTVYAVYTKDVAGEERYVYTAATAITRNDTDPDFADPNLDITFNEKIYRVTYTYTIKKPNAPNWDASSTDYLAVAKSAPVELSSNVHTHKPGQAHGHALGYKVYEPTLAPTDSNDDITVTLYADYMVVTETAPANYTLAEILRKHGDMRGHTEIAADGSQGTFTIYTAGTSADAGFTVTRSGDAANGYFFSAMPESVPTDTGVEFINSRDTVQLTLKEILEDDSHDAGWTHPFHITVRARELWNETNWQGNTVQREHYSMLGTYTITAQNELTSVKTGVTSSAIAVPKNADILVIERFGETAGSNVKYTNYDTTVESDPAGIMLYRPLNKKYLLSTIGQDTTITFTNTLKPRLVTVRKKLIGGDLSRAFNFTGVLTKGGNPVYDTVSGTGYPLFKSASNTEVCTDAEGKFAFTLSGNGSVDIKVPYGSRLEITEVKEESDAFETVYFLDNATAVDGLTATVNGDSENGITVNHELIFTNRSEFSVRENEPTTAYEFYLNADEPYYYTLMGTGDQPLSTYRQFLREGSVLEEPQQPAAPEGQVFLGWFIDPSDGNKCENFRKTAAFDSVSDSETQFSAVDNTVVKLYARFAEVRYVIFHENKLTDTSGAVSWPVMEIVAVEKNTEGKYIIDLNAYTASSEDYREFIGWAKTPEEATATIPAVLANAAYDFTSENGNIELYPGYNMKFRVSFYTGEPGSGATYISSKVLGSDDPIGTVLPANGTFSYKGYTFAGWYYDADHKQPVQNADTITGDKTLYAKWDLPDSATYKVVVWTQNPSDKPGLAFAQKTWAYENTLTFTHTYDKDNDANNVVTPDGTTVKSKAGLDENFTLAMVETGYVETDGTTVLNAYFDRTVYTAVIKQGVDWQGKAASAGYQPTDDLTGELYGKVNGSYMRIERKMYAWRTSEGHTFIVNGAYDPTVFSSYRFRYGIFSTRLRLRNGWRVYNNYAVSEGTTGTILIDSTGTALKTDSSGTRIATGDPDDIGGYTEVSAVYAWYTENGQLYDIDANGAYVLKASDELARYTGLYQGRFDRLEKIEPLLDTNNDGEADYIVRFTYRKTSDSGAATPLDMFDFTLPKARSNVELSNNDTTWTFYAQTNTSQDLPLYIEYYRLSKGETLAEFTASLNVSGTTDSTRTPDIRDPKANVADVSSASRYVYIGNELVKRATWKITQASSYSLNPTLFAGYRAQQFASFYRGTSTLVYQPDSFVTAVDWTNVQTNTSGKMPFKAGTSSDKDNKYGLSLYDGQNNSGTQYIQAAEDGAYYVLKIVYAPEKNNVEFVSGANTVQTLQVYTDWSLNDSTEKWDGTPDYVSSSLTQKAAYDTFLSQGKNLQGQALTDPENQNRIFSGWYYDEECSAGQEFDPNKPVTGNIRVFAKWETRYYVVQIDPAGGVLTGGEAGSTWFWPKHGDTVQNYIVERNYDDFTPEEGSTETIYYYSNYQYKDWGGTYDWDSDKAVVIEGTTYNLNDYTNPPHTATYGTDSTKPNDGKSYREMTGLYSLDRWDYELLDDSGNVTEQGQWYDFSDRVTSNMRLTAVWRKVAPFTIRYEVGDGKFATAQSPYVNFYGDETGFDPATGTSFDVPGTYLDGTTFTIAKAAVPNDSSKQFLGWDVKGGGHTIYPLGSEYVVSSHDADENMIITLAAQYGQIELTSLRYDANGGRGNLTDVTAKTEDVPVRQIWSAGDNSLLHIELNDAVKLSSGKGFFRSGYKLIGWSKEPLTFDRISQNSFETNDGNHTPLSTFFTENPAGTYAPVAGKNCFALGQDTIIDGATGNLLYAVWVQLPYVCKITYVPSGSGSRVFHDAYHTLEDAFKVINGQPPVNSTPNSKQLLPTGVTDLKIEMLVDEYLLPTGVELESKSITLTTAAQSDTDGYVGPYIPSDPNSIAMIKRKNGFSGSNGMIFNKGTMTLTNITLDGNGAQTMGYIVKHGSGALIAAAGATLQNSKSGYGGAIYAEGGSVTVNGGKFTNNQVSNDGGAIYARGETAVIVNSGTFSGNTAGKNGGAIGTYMEQSVTVNGGEFINNRAIDGKGGAIDVSMITVTGGTFSGNSAKSYGGAISILYKDSSFSNAAFNRNTSTFGVGAIGQYYNNLEGSNKGTISITNCTFNENDGGAVELWGPNGQTVQITDCSFTNNTNRSVGARMDRSIIHIYKANLTISNNTVTGNETAGEGASTIYAMDSISNISGNTIANNKSNDASTILLNGTSSHSNVTNNTIRNNKAKNGGAIYTQNGTAVITGNTITENEAQNGGAIFCATRAEGSTRTITGNTITGNTAVTDGGAILVYGGSATLDENTISNNTAGRNGGAIAVGIPDYTPQGTSPAIINGGSITNNTAGGNGGAIHVYHNQSSVNIKGGTITGNTGADGGVSGTERYTVCLSGNPVIYDNHAAGNTTDQRNVVIGRNDNIKVNGALDSSAKIGVYSEPESYDSAGERFGKYTNDGGDPPVSYNTNLDAFWNDKTNDTAGRPLRGMDGGNGWIIWPIGRLTITKQVTGGFGDPTKDFIFTISVENMTVDELWSLNADTPIRIEQPYDEEGEEMERICVFTLKGGETDNQISIFVPARKLVTLKETNAERYTTTIGTGANAPTGMAAGVTGPTEPAASAIKTITFTVANDETPATVTVVNDLPAVSPTGVTLIYAPYFLLMLAGLFLLVMSRKRKERG